MIKTITRLAAMLCLICAVSCATPRDYSSLAQCKGVTMTYFGPGMTGLVSTAVSQAIGRPVNVDDLKLTGIRVIKADGSSAVRGTHAVVMRDVRSQNALPLVELAQGNNRNFGAVYGTPNPAKGGYSQLFVIGEHNKQGFALVLQGNFSSADAKRFEF